MPRPLAAVVIVTLVFLLSRGWPAQKKHSVAKTDVNALIQAIEDEIYDYGYQQDVIDVSKGLGNGRYELPLYVQPDFNNQGLAWAIYKLMPYGEVLRMFSVGRDGLVVLGNDPEFGFPSTEPSYLTIYMDDDELCRDKQQWIKASFVIDIHPSAERLREAEERQKRRLGYSVRLDPSHRMYPPGQDPRCPAADSALESLGQAGDLADPLGYQDSLRAAEEAENGPDPTNGAMHYLLDYGQPLPAWAVGVTPVKTFGPFLKTLGGGAAAKDVKVKIIIFP